jgi:hypothetical protein
MSLHIHHADIMNDVKPKIQRLVGLKWHDVHIKFHKNLSTDPKVTGHLNAHTCAHACTHAPVWMHQHRGSNIISSAFLIKRKK